MSNVQYRGHALVEEVVENGFRSYRPLNDLAHTIAAMCDRNAAYSGARRILPEIKTHLDALGIKLEVKTKQPSQVVKLARVAWDGSVTGRYTPSPPNG